MNELETKLNLLMNTYINNLDYSYSTDQKLNLGNKPYLPKLETSFKLKADLSNTDKTKWTEDGLRYVVSNMVKSAWMNHDCTELEFKSAKFQITFDEDDQLVFKC